MPYRNAVDRLHADRENRACIYVITKQTVTSDKAWILYSRKKARCIAGLFIHLKAVIERLRLAAAAATALDTDGAGACTSGRAFSVLHVYRLGFCGTMVKRDRAAT